AGTPPPPPRVAPAPLYPFSSRSACIKQPNRLSMIGFSEFGRNGVIRTLDPLHPIFLYIVSTYTPSYSSRPLQASNRKALQLSCCSIHSNSVRPDPTFL